MENTKPILRLVPIELPEEYRKKWNEHMKDFVRLAINENIVNDSLYRVGGFGAKLTDGYFMLLKYVEDYYSDSITKIKKDKQHLSGRWCIIDKNGVEKVVFDSFKNPYLTGGQVYSLDSKYYNIETGELYCDAFTYMKSSEFIFLANLYDKDESRRGVMKINKKDGTWELFH